MNTKLPGKWPCKCGAEMELRSGSRATGNWRYECAACGTVVSNSSSRDGLGAELLQPTPKRRVLAAKSKPGRAVKLLLPLLTDWG